MKKEENKEQIHDRETSAEEEGRRGRGPKQNIMKSIRARAAKGSENTQTHTQRKRERERERWKEIMSKDFAAHTHGHHRMRDTSKTDE